MMRHLLPLLLLTATACTSAQPARTLSDDDWCSDRSRSDGRETACEVREVVLQQNAVRADAAPNGGFEVHVWDRPDILVRARIEAGAASRSRAEALLAASRLETGSVIRLNAPDTNRNEWVSASYEMYVPRRTDLDLNTVNGGIEIAGVRGKVRFQAVNGGITLDDVGGDVAGSTTNGGIDLRLSGTSWEGAGLDLQTTNGGVDVRVPARYSAEFEARTTHGDVDIGRFPLARECANRPSQYVPCMGGGVSGTLGQGGARVRAVTTNGGVALRQR